MIAGNPDHRDDASQPLSRFIKTFPLVIDASPRTTIDWGLVCFTLLVTSFSWPRPGAIDHTGNGGNDTLLHNVTRLMEPPEGRHTADILIRTRLLIVTEF